MAMKYNFKKRRDCRVFAMQTIFSALLLEQEWDEVVKELFEQTDWKLEGTFALELIENVLKKKYDVIAAIKPLIKNKWEFERLDIQDQSLLLLSGYELLYTDTPKKIVINEALEITKIYGDLESKSFINAILDKLK